MPAPSPATDGEGILAQMRQTLLDMKNQVTVNEAILNNLKSSNNNLEQKVLGIDYVIENLHGAKKRMAE